MLLRSFWNRWWYTVLMMAAYVALFVYWKLWPSRLAFVVGALLVAGGLAVAMWIAARRGYFAGRIDIVLHALVIVDVFLEGTAFELVLLWVGAGTDVPRLAVRYHDSSGFLLCSLLFAAVLSTGHYFGMRRRAAAAAALE